MKRLLNAYKIRVSGLGCPERLISTTGAGACGVVGVGMLIFVVVAVVVSVAPPGWVAAVGRATHPRPTRGPMGPMGPI